ncbi:cytochrome P450 [Gammaproteobacteria bacterium 45_16_T64]|nr:cytochrome P450 [Gammaproteobacteria bacterium 45_16_T64]
MSTPKHGSQSPHINHQNIPGDKGKLLVGYTLDFINNHLDLIASRYERYGEISWSSLFGIHMVHMLGADANEFVLQNKDNVFSNHQGWDFFIGKFFNRGIMLLDFEEHRWHRKILQQAFNRNALQTYLQHMGEYVEQGIQPWTTQQYTKISPLAKRLTLDLATHIFMGAELGAETDKLNQAFIDAVRGGTAVVRYAVPGGRWSKGLKGRKVLETFFKQHISTKREQPGSDMFSALCMAKTEDGSHFSDEDIINHMIFIMMAAHDTTTMTLSVMIYYLAKHPEWQEKIRTECRAVGTQHIAYDDLSQLPSISLVMKEALRLCPPVPTLPRKTVKPCTYKGRFIPKGSMVLISLYHTGHMEDLWPNAQAFDPERFTEDRREDKIHPYAWVPFGGGAHKCIGLHFAELQVKAIMFQLIQRYRWSVPPDYVMPVDTTSLPVPGDDLPVYLERCD